MKRSENTPVCVFSSVPFYFQPTLGGCDIDGAPFLTSHQDYRGGRRQSGSVAGDLGFSLVSHLAHTPSRR
jgi:hypothetical protein